MSTSPDLPLPDASTSVAAESAEPKPVRRRRTAKAPAAESTTAEGGALAQGVDAPAAEQVQVVVEPAKTPRRRRTAAPAEPSSAEGQPVELAPSPSQADTPGAAEPLPSEATSAPEAMEGEVESADEASASEASPGRSERIRRRNRRERQRANRGLEAAGEGAEGNSGPRGEPGELVQARSPQEVVDLFAQVVSGDFDVEDAASPQAPAVEVEQEPQPVEAEVAEPQVHKRVLPPDPDAPKLQKVLGQAGVGSRRDMEELILDGRVTVNGEPAHIGQRISFGDRIEVNGKPIKYRIAPPTPRVIAYHKPVGEVVTRDDPQQRPTVFRRLPQLQHGKWQSVGRLDINTEGLLLFTNSGELANQLMHPRFGVEREYAVRVLGTLDPEARDRLLQGVMVEGQPAGFKSIEDGGGEGANHWYRVVITEGRNREVRKLFDTVGLTVSRLIRIRYGTVVLPRGLKRGVWVDLGDADVRLIRQLAGGRRDRSPEGSPQRDGGGRGPQGASDRGPRPNNRGGRGGRGEPPPRSQGFEPAAREPRDFDSDEELDFDPSRIPNPLEQTFDRRFAQSGRSPFGRGGAGGFGAGGSAPNPSPKQRGNGPREPDPLQTSVGYIGADAFHRKGGRGGSGGGGGGGFGGGNRGGRRGGGGRGGQRGR